MRGDLQQDFALAQIEADELEIEASPDIASPPCDEARRPEVVPLPKSRFSTSATLRPRKAASRAMPQPMIPPPMMATSNSGAAVAGRRARVKSLAQLDWRGIVGVQT